MVSLKYPRDGETIELLTPCQREFTGGGNGAAIEDWLKLHRSDKEDCTHPRAVAFEWESDSKADVLEISTDADFRNVRRLVCTGKRAEAGNLMLGTAYYWRVNGSEARVFHTEDAAPRWLKVDGMSNVRDMGAWKTMDGRRVKQGLIYRGSEMDTHHSITEQGKWVMQNEMGIRTDLDLRGEAVGKLSESPAGSDINYMLMPCVAYESFLAEEQKPMCKALFDVLADERNYPIYFHCWGGADRTGTLAFMLESVLGLSDDDMIRDYELTSLSVWGERSRSGDWFASLVKGLEAYGDAGDSLREKALNFLRSCGIDDAVFEKLRINLLEKV
ncbi:MAG: tyrosine-protein phosphatase [Clostridia bacterium]|nr:tyrosine-protein phosphatase [Clostridia bacterium]